MPPGSACTMHLHCGRTDLVNSTRKQRTTSWRTRVGRLNLRGQQTAVYQGDDAPTAAIGGQSLINTFRDYLSLGRRVGVSITLPKCAVTPDQA